MLLALLLVGLLGAATVKPFFANHPHIPWLAVKVASEAAASEATIDDCRSLSAAFLQMLLRVKSSKEDAENLMNEFDKGGEGCPTRLSVSVDKKRWPQLLVHVQCSCERRQCHVLGSYCSTILGSVEILRMGSNNRMLPSREVVPVGCICSERSSKKAKVVSASAEITRK